MMMEKEKKLSEAKALELVGGLVERLVGISKEEDIDITDYEDLKKNLRVILLKSLREKIEEPISHSTEESEFKRLAMFGGIEEPIGPLQRVVKPFISVEVGREDTESGIPTVGIKSEEYLPMSIKRIEKEGTANASFF
ncbi:hypothetical protein C5S32_01105 [ANME-1 cluster archaeon GoMg1]|nr:hypothetical protein [ANME-1 cluster archaeon GoMg1]